MSTELSEFVESDEPVVNVLIEPIAEIAEVVSVPADKPRYIISRNYYRNRAKTGLSYVVRREDEKTGKAYKSIKALNLSFGYAPENEVSFGCGVVAFAEDVEAFETVDELPISDDFVGIRCNYGNFTLKDSATVSGEEFAEGTEVNSCKFDTFLFKDDTCLYGSREGLLTMAPSPVEDDFVELSNTESEDEADENEESEE